jgi:hypothetical protein
MRRISKPIASGFALFLLVFGVGSFLPVWHFPARYLMYAGERGSLWDWLTNLPLRQWSDVSENLLISGFLLGLSVVAWCVGYWVANRPPDDPVLGDYADGREGAVRDGQVRSEESCKRATG